MLKKNELCGAIVYYDGMHNDARMCISIAITAARLGAAIANHVKVLDLVKEDCKVKGARCRNEIDGEEFVVKAKSVINATGPFTDSIRWFKIIFITLSYSKTVYFSRTSVSNTSYVYFIWLSVGCYFFRNEIIVYMRIFVFFCLLNGHTHFFTWYISVYYELW